MNKISCVIIHHKGLLINKCLESLKALDVEKIVVTSDWTWKNNFKDVKRFLTTYNNPSFKRNIGVSKSNEEYIVFLDDDVEVTPSCIRRMKDLLEGELNIGMVYATLLKTDNHNIIDTSGSFLTWCGFLNETYTQRNTFYTPVLSAKSACCMIRKDLLEKIGGFDNDFVIYGEETDLSWRVWLAGYIVVIRNEAIAYHSSETSLKPKDFYNKEFIHYHGCKNYITMLLKNLPYRMFWMVLINALIWLFMGVCLWFKNRQASKWIFRGIWYNIKNLRYILNKRKKINRVSEDFYPTIIKNPPFSYFWVRCKEYLTHKIHTKPNASL